jgi:uncharacterized protein
MTGSKAVDVAPESSPPPDRGPRRPWEACVLPLAAFMALGALEPTPSGGGPTGWLGIPPAAYPLVYAVKLAATLALLAWQWRNIRPWLGRASWWPAVVGLFLVIPWVVLAGLERQAGLDRWLESLGGGAGARAAFDPFAAWGAGSPAAYAWLAVRGLGLVVVVPLVEELFLRGFLMRYVVDEEFWRVPFGTVTAAAAVACVAYAVLTHPAEAVAAAVWFSTVTGIAAATRQPIDCVVAHAATNLALGAWVLATGAWWLV